MRKILNIAKLELDIMFFSPIAWLVMIIFIFQSGLHFTDLLERYESMQQLHQELKDLTGHFFAQPYEGLFSMLQSKVYLYIPLLTMGLISREKSSGTIKLLLSSPVKFGEIIMGKFLAMMGYGFLLILVLFVFVIAGHTAITALDIPFTLSGLLGLYLLICAYSAIGIFMSCLTSYQVAAAFSTLVVFAFLGYIGQVGQDLDFVRDLTYFLSISGRSDKMIDGLIRSKDVLYFLIVITLFLGLSVLKLLGERENGSRWLKTGRYAGLIGSCLLVGYVSSRPAMVGYIDMTRNKDRTLTQNSQSLLRQLKGPLQVTTYVNMLDLNMWYGLPVSRNQDLDRFEMYTRFLPDLDMKYVYYYDQPDPDAYKGLKKRNPGLSDSAIANKTAITAKFDFDRVLPPSEMKKIIDLEPEEHRFIRQLQAGSRKSFLRIYSDMPTHPFEMEISAAIKRLVATPPKVGFLSGSNERTIDRSGDKDYKMSAIQLDFRYSLINQGFDVVTVRPEAAKIPDDIDILVIADPRWKLDTAAMTAVQAYIDKGGNLLIAAEPGKQDVVNPLLRPLGVRMTEGRLIEESKDYAPDFILAQFGDQSGKMSGDYTAMAAKHSMVSMPGTGTLEYSDSAGFAITPILVTNPKNTWNRTRKIDNDSAVIRFDPQEGDSKKSSPAVLSLSRRHGGREQRIVVAADADFFSNKELFRAQPRTMNFVFSIDLFGWLSNDEFPVDVQRKTGEDTRIKITESSLFNYQLVLLGIFPALLLVSGTILLIRRRSK